MTSELLSLPVTALAARIRTGELSPLEVVDAHIARIEKVNPKINGLVVDRFEAARAEARAAERTLAATRARGELPPLFGVPCTIKEFLAVAGLPQTGGLVSRKHAISTSDATVVERLRAAGAIILGITNVPEGGMWLETANNVYGRTNNPWNLARTAGGSSGGEAALIAAGASPFGIGSDIAGSIRIPAAMCGIAGHKPTAGLVPNTGHWGAEGMATSRYLVCGPMARSVGDLSVILSAIAGPDGHDPFARPWRPGRPDDVDLSSVVVYPIESVPGVPLHPAVRAGIRHAAAALGERGAQVRQLSPARLREALAIWMKTMNDSAEESAASFERLISEGEAMTLSVEVVRALAGRGRYTLPSLGLIAAERVGRFVPPWLKARVASATTLQAELEDALGETGVLLYPPYSRPAPRHNAPLLRPLDFICTGVFNIVGFPATEVPLGFDPQRLPVGVQVVARRGNDHLTIAVAAAIEREIGPWVMAPL